MAGGTPAVVMERGWEAVSAPLEGRGFGSEKKLAEAGKNRKGRLKVVR